MALRRVTVLGAGSWGTALAMQLARVGTNTRLWGRNEATMATMAAERRNTRYLPDAEFPEGLEPTADLSTALDFADLVLVATPSHAFADTVETVGKYLPHIEHLAWATKGLEPGSGRFLHEVAADVLGSQLVPALVTGPSFAKEVALGLPTAITVASPDLDFAEAVAATLHGGCMRVYTIHDIVGAELGGAMKNVLAVATGISDGMELGNNARAALVTRGLAELMRLASALGAQRDTLMGLAGVGDLVLTCTSSLSRNWRFGNALGRGLSQEEAQREIGQTIEGRRTAEEVLRLAKREDVELPITEQVAKVLRLETTPAQGLQELLAREPKHELL